MKPLKSLKCLECAKLSNPLNFCRCCGAPSFMDDRDAWISDVNDILCSYLQIAHFQITPDKNIIHDLGADDMDMILIATELEKIHEFVIPNEVFKNIKTVQDFYNLK